MRHNSFGPVRDPRIRMSTTGLNRPNTDPIISTAIWGLFDVSGCGKSEKPANINSGPTDCVNPLETPDYPIVDQSAQQGVGETARPACKLGYRRQTIELISSEKLRTIKVGRGPAEISRCMHLIFAPQAGEILSVEKWNSSRRKKLMNWTENRFNLCRNFCGFVNAVLYTATFLLPFVNCPVARAIDINNVGNGAIDQPRMNMLLRLPGNPPSAPLDGTALDDNLNTVTTYTIEGFYDTGSGASLIAEALIPDDATGFGIPLEPADWIFSDTGVGGVENFRITQPLIPQLAPFHPTVDLDNPATFDMTYNQVFPAMRFISKAPPTNPSPGPTDPLEEYLGLSSQFNVFGIELFSGKVAVMDGRALNEAIPEIQTGDITALLNLLSTAKLKTYVYDPGTSFQQSFSEFDPGIPETNLHIQTTFVDFSDFVEISASVPAGSGPAFGDNPFIGPNPLNPGGSQPPPVTFTRDGQSVNASVLFDTGAGAGFVSSQISSSVGIRYKPGQEPAAGNEDPRLQRFDSNGGVWIDLTDSEQFELTIGGVGGQFKVAGTWFDSFQVPTIEGQSNPDLNLNYNNTPFVVLDVSVRNPDTDEVFTLDGVFGMNKLFAHAQIDEPIDLAQAFNLLATFTASEFDWVTFDHGTGEIGLAFVPEPASSSLLAAGTFLFLIAWRRYRSTGRAPPARF